MLYHIIYTIALVLITVVLGKQECPGKCTTTADCHQKGGKVKGHCKEEKSKLVCCNLSLKTVATCDHEKIGLESAIFQSPAYPKYSSGDILCPFHFHVSDDNYNGLLVEFLDVFSDGTGFRWGPDSGGVNLPCENDMIFLRGFRNWQPPPRCGNLTGFAVVIESSSDPKEPNFLKSKELKIVSLMSSRKWRWKIKISILMSKSNQKKTAKSVHQPEESAQSVIEPLKHHISKREISPEFNDNRIGIEEPLVVNGVDTDISTVPWQASLRMFYPDFIFGAENKHSADFYNRMSSNCSIEGVHFCGGSIISDEYILSAAHCFIPDPKVSSRTSIDDVKVYLGETDLCQDDFRKYGRKTQSFRLEKIILHYGYDAQHIGLNDVVLLKLKGKIKFNDYIKPITLANRKEPYFNNDALLSGWGRTNLSINQLPLILQSTNETSVGEKEYCSSWVQTVLTENQTTVESYRKFKNTFNSVFCADVNDTSYARLFGQGDSGGPLVVFENDTEDASKQKAVLVGIVSYFIAQAATANSSEFYVDIYEDVGQFRDWIDAAMLA